MSKQLDSILSRATTTTPRKLPPVAANSDGAGQGRVTKLKSEPQPKAEPAAEPQKSLQVYVPASVAKALNVMAAQEESTVRSLVLRSLTHIGIEVPDAEIRDRRK